MIYTNLSTRAKPAPLRYALLVVFLLVVLYWAVIYPWMTNWDATPAEQRTALPGDELHPDSTALDTGAYHRRAGRRRKCHL